MNQSITVKGLELAGFVEPTVLKMPQKLGVDSSIALRFLLVITATQESLVEPLGLFEKLIQGRDIPNFEAR